MKNKLITQLIITATILFLVWFGLSKIDFVSFFEIEKNSKKIENKIGNLIWDEIKKDKGEITNDSINILLDKLIEPICKANNIHRDSLHLHLVQEQEINAFALPNNHLVLYTGLIAQCQKQEALQGVLGHEIAHIQNNHVMKKLSKEFGLSIILSTTTGSGGETLTSIFKSLSSTAYDRTLEKEADIASINYLIKAGINPQPMADFMYNLAQNGTTPNYLEWLSTHPESEDRAKYIIEYSKNKKHQNKQTLTQKQWEKFKEKSK